MEGRAQLVNVRASQLSSKLSSKKDLYDVMKDHSESSANPSVQFFLPGYLYTPIRFLKEILSGDKVVSLALILRLSRLRMCRNATSRSMMSSRSTSSFRRLWTSSQRWRITSLTTQISTCLQGISSGASSVLCILTLSERSSRDLRRRELPMKRTKKKSSSEYETISLSN